MKRAGVTYAELAKCLEEARPQGVGSINSEQIESRNNRGNVPSGDASGAGIGGDSSGKPLGDQGAKAAEKEVATCTKSHNRTHNPEEAALLQNSPNAPRKRQIAKCYLDNAKKHGLRFGWHPVKRFVGFLDKINGLLTALATVAIAILTIVVARDANKQDTVSTGQLRIMQGQLDEMRASSTQTDKLIKATSDQAKSESASVQAFINSERGQLFIGSMTLNQKTPTDPNPTVSYSIINMGHSPVVISTVAVKCMVISVIDATPDYTMMKASVGNFTIGSGASFDTSGTTFNLHPCTFAAPLSATDWSEIATGAEYIMIIGGVAYKDDFHSYAWTFGSIYGGASKYFTTWGLPASYNQETKTD